MAERLAEALLRRLVAADREYADVILGSDLAFRSKAWNELAEAWHLARLFVDEVPVVMAEDAVYVVLGGFEEEDQRLLGVYSSRHRAESAHPSPPGPRVLGFPKRWQPNTDDDDPVEWWNGWDDDKCKVILRMELDPPAEPAEVPS